MSFYSETLDRLLPPILNGINFLFHKRRMRWKRRRSFCPARRARPRAMTTATSAHLSGFMRDPYPSGCVKEQFRVSLRPYGAGRCLPRHGHGPARGRRVLLSARAVVAQH